MTTALPTYETSCEGIRWLLTLRAKIKEDIHTHKRKQHKVIHIGSRFD